MPTGLRRWVFLAVLACLGCQADGGPHAHLPTRHSIEFDHLLVLSDFKLNKQHPLLVDLIQLRRQIVEALQLPISERPVVVYLFRDEPHYHEYLRFRFPHLPPRRAYFVRTNEELAVYTFWGERIQEDLRHEFTHGLLHSCLAAVPLWLDEGLAEYFEVAGPTPGAVNVDYANQLAVAINNQWRPDVRRLEQLEDVSGMQLADYQESWACVHYLLHGAPELKPVLLDYLQELRSEAHPAPLSQRLLEQQPDLEERLLNYLASLNTFRNVTASVGAVVPHALR